MVGKLSEHDDPDLGYEAAKGECVDTDKRWMKGNPHPGNRYGCTPAGCPVHKYIETAIDGSNAVIITYKGTHDYAMHEQRESDMAHRVLLSSRLPLPGSTESWVRLLLGGGSIGSLWSLVGK